MKLYQGSHPSWAYLFHQLGQDNYLCVDYGITGTQHKKPDNIVSTFAKYGYRGATLKITTVPGNDIDNELKQNSPVFIRGATTGGGHAWLIDGLRKRTITGMDNITEYYYRCVWGYSGMANGYFYFSGYDRKEIGGSPESKFEHESGSVDKYELSYIITGYRPVR